VTYAQFPYDTLRKLGGDLVDISVRLGEKERGANDCQGLGSDGQDRIQHAIGHFRDEWKASVKQLVDDIDNWGGLSKAIGDLVSQFDTQTAQDLRGAGNRSPR
jgi:hypothetical protein